MLFVLFCSNLVAPSFRNWCIVDVFYRQPYSEFEFPPTFLSQIKASQFGLLRNGLWEPYKSNTFAIDVIQKKGQKTIYPLPFFFHVRPATLTRSSRFAAQYHQNIFEIVFESWNQNNLSKYFPMFPFLSTIKSMKKNISWTCE